MTDCHREEESAILKRCLRIHSASHQRGDICVCSRIGARTYRSYTAKRRLFLLSSLSLHLGTDGSGTLFISAGPSPAGRDLKGDIVLDTPSASTLWPSPPHFLPPSFSPSRRLPFIPALADLNFASASLSHSARRVSARLRAALAK